MQNLSSKQQKLVTVFSDFLSFHFFSLLSSLSFLCLSSHLHFLCLQLSSSSFFSFFWWVSGPTVDCAMKFSLARSFRASVKSFMTWIQKGMSSPDSHSTLNNGAFWCTTTSILQCKRRVYVGNTWESLPASWKTLLPGWQERPKKPPDFAPPIFDCHPRREERPPFSPFCC